MGIHCLSWLCLWSCASRDTSLCSGRKTCSTVDRGPVPPVQESDGGGLCKQSWVGGGGVLPLLPGNQGDWWLSSHSQPQQFERLPPRLEVQDANFDLHFMWSPSCVLDDFSQPEWQLCPHPSPSFTQMVSEVHVERPRKHSPLHVSVGCSSTLPSCHSLTTVYKVAGPGGSPPSLQDHVYVPVHRWYRPCLGLIDPGLGCKGHEHPTSSSTRLFLNPGKSSLIPSQVMTHPGASLDTLAGVIRCTPDKVQEIYIITQSLFDVSLAPLKGGRSHGICHATVLLCLFRLKLISSHLSRNFRRRSHSLPKQIPLNVPEVVEALRLWPDPIKVEQ